MAGKEQDRLSNSGIEEDLSRYVEKVGDNSYFVNTINGRLLLRRNKNEVWCIGDKAVLVTNIKKKSHKDEGIVARTTGIGIDLVIGKLIVSADVDEPGLNFKFERTQKTLLN